MALSERMRDTVESIVPKIATQVAQRSSSNPPVDLGTAENWLIRSELVDFFKDAISKNLVEQDLSYQKGFAGDPNVIAALADTFNRLFSPRIPVEPSHIAVGPGGAAILESLLINICDSGDVMLVLAPFWSGFHFQFNVGPKVGIVPVTSLEENVFNENVVKDLEDALAKSEKQVKGVVLCNPHNPLGQCYTKGALEAIAKFCEKHDLHLISDEIYALSIYNSVDLPHPEPFVSILNLDFEEIKVNPARAHVIWSVSKDFGCSGFRLGALVSQGSPAMACGVAMAANTQVSGLTAVAVTALLSDPAVTDRFIGLNRSRLSSAYESMATFLRAHNIRYIPANAGIYVWAKLSSKVTNWEQEAKLTELLAEKKVAVSAGKSYAAAEPGWYRLSFALKPEQLERGLERLGEGIEAFEKLHV
ncbi:1-aminocyclopropane-1-carboxylate synthase [Diplodia corticola]|uniref:1-aminocyclopropane-1-carboxylate synthase n=1 Tax=Diplodia corticola TaxID=236234 RepID=A0A1J9QSK3_9PEZI|nr:1-aminocyclopropane-1-carboxylate synthase [Diplodia corticola]OJD30970.1 1-aminocyclopropane-1-carboxylate synthase [Diplodia corticola]